MKITVNIEAEPKEFAELMTSQAQDADKIASEMADRFKKAMDRTIVKDQGW